jgi:(p)ppGpp synthase/HD superfamily hydrolase
VNLILPTYLPQQKYSHEMNADPITISAGLLHDLVEDTEVSDNRLEK